MVDEDFRMFTAVPHDNVVIGSCVMIMGDQLLYAGPITTTPNPIEGCTMLLHPQDLSVLAEMTRKYSH